ncbi:redoxin domain-containing protein [Mycoplasmopsis citelli]|uniref:redoxin domain-containing protein n=1 Tax=Mycoplasmopsis citelli TaxID=171281 RepID=UPI00211522B0|nr:redoxin domain-containing protein [Mycoplasmopsis citelli]UUD36390.1 redoxin domain-containing protein [Mycoplasmopsis citelli]
MKKVNFLDKEYALLGTEVQLGDTVTVKGVLPGTFETKEFQNDGKYTVLTLYPSVGGRVCDRHVTQTESIAPEYPNVNFVGLSQDLPTALAGYVDSHQIKHVKLMSDYKHREVAQSLGLLMDEVFLNARAALVLDKDYKIVYKQVNDVVHELIDFDALKEFLNKL